MSRPRPVIPVCGRISVVGGQNRSRGDAVHGGVPGLAGPGPGSGETAVDDRPAGRAWGVEATGAPVVAPTAAQTQALP